MPKVLYAINQKQFEEILQKKLGANYVTVNTATYREAILSMLPGSDTDILILLESLPGSSDISRMMEQLRVEYPELRIIIMCNGDRGPGDPFLNNLVSLGICDIIVSNPRFLNE